MSNLISLLENVNIEDLDINKLSDFIKQIDIRLHEKTEQSKDHLNEIQILKEQKENMKARLLYLNEKLNVENFDKWFQVFKLFLKQNFCF